MNILLLTTIVMSHLFGSSRGHARCGRGPHSPTSRIIGGSMARDYIPWQVVIYKNKKFICGGSIIHRIWVVTAAHCMVGARPDQILIRYGTLDRHSGPLARVSVIIIHPSFGGRQAGWADDVAIIKLSEPLIFSSRVGSICMPRTGARPGSDVRITGFGRLDSGVLPRKLHTVDVHVSTFSVCKQRYPWVDPSRFICAGDNGQGSCRGDSGGPMSYFRAGRWELQGIVSFGPTTCRVRTDYPNGYTRVVHFVGWIRSRCNCV